MELKELKDFNERVSFMRFGEKIIFFDTETMNLGYADFKGENSEVNITNLARKFQLKSDKAVTPKHSNNLMLRILLTNRCNLNCEYCQMKQMTVGKPSSDIDFETIDRIIENVTKSNYDYITIHFSGGEPTLSMDKIEHTCKKVSECGLKNVRFAISTNGTLLKEKAIEILKKYDIQTVISIDGYKEANKLRKFRNNTIESINSVLNSYNRVREKGLSTGVSMVFNNKYKHETIDAIKELKTAYDIKSLGLNYIHYSGFDKNMEMISETEDYMEEYAKTLFESYEECKALNIFEEQSNRIIEPFVYKKPRKTHCSSQASQVTVNPDGSISPCKTFASAKIDTIEFENWVNNFSRVKGKCFDKWYSRSTESVPKCKKCSVRSFCGGGCGYEAFVDYNDIMHADTRYCVVPKYFFKRIISKLNDNGAFKDSSVEVKLLRDEYRIGLLSSNDPDKYKLTSSIGHMLEK